MGTIMKDTSASGREEHSVVEAVDEVGLGGCFVKSGDKV